MLPLPNRGEVFLDPRGEGRSLRVSWHRDRSTLVLSLWQLGQCRATFRLATEEVPDLVRALVAGLADGLADHRELTERLTSQLEPTAAPGTAVAPVAAEKHPKPPKWNRPPVRQPAPADELAAGVGDEVVAEVVASEVAGPTAVVAAEVAPPEVAGPTEVVAEPAADAEPPTVVADPPTVVADPPAADVAAEPTVVVDAPTVATDAPTVAKRAAKPRPGKAADGDPQVKVTPAIFLAPPGAPSDQA